MARNLSRVITSPRLMNPLPLTVLRPSGSWIKGEWTPGVDEEISTVGIEAGVSDEEVLQLPEGDRVKALKKFLTPILLKGSDTSKTPDRVISSDGATWQVKFVDNRMVNGFSSAVCVRIKLKVV